MVSTRAKRSRTAVAAAEAVDQSENDGVVLAIEKLQELQEELQQVNEEAREKILEIEKKCSENRKQIYVKRNEIINSIPDFWMTVFLSHLTLADLLTDEDQEIFMYLDSLNVEDFNDPRKGYCITFDFKANPYFENAKLTKTIKFFDEGTMSSIGTTIKWKEGKAPAESNNDVKKGRKRPLDFDNFFSWFSYSLTNTMEAQDEVADIIKEEIWPDPIERLNNADDDEDESDDEEEEEEKVDEEGGNGNGDE